MCDNPPDAVNDRDANMETQPILISSQQLFSGRDEIWIEHQGERYRLRITKRGRLILQK